MDPDVVSCPPRNSELVAKNQNYVHGGDVQVTDLMFAVTVWSVNLSCSSSCAFAATAEGKRSRVRHSITHRQDESPTKQTGQIVSATNPVLDLVDAALIKQLFLMLEDSLHDRMHGVDTFFKLSKREFDVGLLRSFRRIQTRKLTRRAAPQGM